MAGYLQELFTCLHIHESSFDGDMQDPTREIAGIVTILATSPLDVQKATIEKYFTPDAGFSHPICAVKRGPDSRQNVIGIYQWYRIMSPNTSISVKEVVHHKETDVLYLEIVQNFHIRFNPFSTAPSRLITRLSLRKQDGLYYITLQEDFYHPEDFVSLVVPPLKTLVGLGLGVASLVSGFNARVAHTFGLH